LFPVRLSLVCALVAPLLACGPEKEVWFAPNIGSPDMLDLFTRPEEWPRARAQVRVFKFYEQQLLAPADVGCEACGPNVLPGLEGVGAFARLSGWGISVAVEAGAVKEWGCTADATAPLALRAVTSVESRGARVDSLAMDEPILGGEACSVSLPETADRTAEFVRRLRSARPALRVGDIEPYPHLLAPALVAWLQALQARGVRPAFFHLDVDRREAARLGTDVAGDLAMLQKVCASLGIRFGVIVWGQDGTSDRAYFEDVLAWVRTVSEAIGRPEDMVFQSWIEGEGGREDIPVNLPENDPAVYSHTRLLDDSLALLGQFEASR
jgi:hypothetical protein